MIITSSISRYAPRHLKAMPLLPESVSPLWRLDKTGRQWLTQQTVWALLNWLKGPIPALKDLNHQLLCHRVTEYLGPVTPLKARYIRMMLAGLCGDWKTMRGFRPSLLKKELVHMICTLDQFGLTYRSDINRILKNIGELPVLETGTEADEFTLKTSIELHFDQLMNWVVTRDPDTDDPEMHPDRVIRCWLAGLRLRSA